MKIYDFKERVKCRLHGGISKAHIHPENGLYRSA